MSKKKVLRIYPMRAVFENLDTGNCLIATQVKDQEGSLRDLRVCSNTELSELALGTPIKVIEIEAIFGIYDFFSGSFVALVVKSEPYLNTTTMTMRLATEIIVVPLFGNVKLLSERKQNDEDTFLSLLEKGFADHNLFFSDNCDITHTQQRIAKFSSTQLVDTIWQRADHRFFWNLVSILDLIACNAREWIQPFMSAFVDYRPDCECNSVVVGGGEEGEGGGEGLKFNILLISRRSRYRQGCRFTRRGIDEQGNVANFVETEQIILYPNGKITAHVQVRGSIPLQWSSPVSLKYEPKVFISEDLTRSTELCSKHVNELLSCYSDNSGASGLIFINLIDSDIKKSQGKLGVAFKQLIDGVRGRVLHPLHYIAYDFHKETKKTGKWNNLASLIMQANTEFQAQRYFCRQASGVVTSYQIGVIRINCMDNLDRTNVVQSLFARRSLITQLGNAKNGNDMNGGGGINRKGASSGILASSMSPAIVLTKHQQDEILSTPWKSFEVIYKTIWTNNANALSLLYSGTGALKTDFTLTGKRTFKGMWNDGTNSAERFYINNFTDGEKQDSIDLMLGNYRADGTAPSPFVSSFHDHQKETISDVLNKLFTLTLIIFMALLLLFTGAHSRGIRIISKIMNKIATPICLAIEVILTKTVGEDKAKDICKIIHLAMDWIFGLVLSVFPMGSIQTIIDNDVDYSANAVVVDSDSSLTADLIACHENGQCIDTNITNNREDISVSGDSDSHRSPSSLIISEPGVDLILISCLQWSLIISACVGFITLIYVVKFGSTIGERIAVHPRLIKEANF